MKMKKIIYTSIFLISLIFIEGLYNGVRSAEKITLVKSIFGRSITIEELRDFAYNGVKSDFLKRSIRKRDEEKIIMIIQKEYKAPIVLTSKLLYSNIGF